MKKIYDLAIIGSGPGGYVAAIRASQLGMSVAVIEKKELGGICLNWGCIPTKTLLRSSEIYEYIKNSENFGFDTKKSNYNLNHIIKRSRHVAKKLSTGIEYLFKKNKIDLINGTAKFNKDKELEVHFNNNNQIIAPKNIIIATGASPKKIKTSNDKIGMKLWNYFDAMIPKEIPKNLGIIGSGAIGIEFASFYNSLGANVTVFEMQNRILANEDSEISKFLKDNLSKKGISFHLNSGVNDVKEAQDFKLVVNNLKTNEKSHFNFDKILVAIGIEGNVNNIGLENTKIKIEKNHIVTYSFGKTDEENIFAIGDVTGAPWLAHKASHEGIKCVEFIAGKIKKEEKMIIPLCVYCYPQVASIGLTEEQATNKGIKIKTGKFPLSANGKALALSESEGFVKTIFEAHTGQIIGAHLVGAEVTELINTFSLAIKLEATELDIFSTIFPHPTVSESIHESALDAFDKAIHI